ncbi:Uncharacterized protein SCG7086_AL_00280 [Chlamydiales bacterium SCGC AG-110-P3]|nr:Uncharacterized protein SCG7086_AL_00280 [Chlamydiales bacterium SCGC AG-110-P3]
MRGSSGQSNNTPRDVLGDKLARAEEVLLATQGSLGFIEKLDSLAALPIVQRYLDKPGPVKTFIAGLTPECDVVLRSVIALGQADIVFRIPEGADKFELLRQLLQELVLTERFYDTIGGLVGYYTQVLRILTAEDDQAVMTQYLRPEGIDITTNTESRRNAVVAAIHGMHQVAEIYPVGGAGDRLNLLDIDSGEQLPAARLIYDGRTLFENLVTDLQAREYLRYRLTGRQVTTPVAVMTSKEKNNHSHITEICKEAGWFGRGKESFRFFEQPLVPVLTEAGDFSMKAPLQMNVKPGGHGVIWKLAVDSGVFEWLADRGCTKAVVKQVNNPMADTDAGMLGFIGTGLSNDHRFGFASCDRIVDAAEGMNVLIEQSVGESIDYCLTNVEYTEFSQRGIEDVPVQPGSRFSAFPCNTNILWIDLPVVAATAKQHPIPGMLLNMKTLMPSMDSTGCIHDVHSGRLESTMQNIADHLVDRFDVKLPEGQHGSLRTFLTYNTRRKTMSATKSLHHAGEPLVGTIEGCYYDHLHNMYELVTQHCRISTPGIPSEQEYCSQGPSWMFSFHPALGPLYSVIGDKIRGGVIHEGAELRLDIAEVDIADIDLAGSLIVEADCVMGKVDTDGLLHYSDQIGRVCLKNVVVSNAGVDVEEMTQRSGNGVAPPYATGHLARREVMHVLIHGNGEFVAEGVTFCGGYSIEVPAGVRMTVRQEGEIVVFDEEKIHNPSWNWHYEESKDGELTLTRINKD